MKNLSYIERGQHFPEGAQLIVLHSIIPFSIAWEHLRLVQMI